MHFDHIHPLLQTFPRYPLPSFMLSVSVPPSLPSSVPLFHTFSVSLQPIKSSLHWLTIPGRETCPGVSNKVNYFCPTNANKMNMSYKNSSAFLWKEGGGGNPEPVFPCGGAVPHCTVTGWFLSPPSTDPLTPSQHPRHLLTLQLAGFVFFARNCLWQNALNLTLN